MARETFTLGARSLHPMPEEQKLITLDDPTIILTHFTDAAHYHPALVAKILELEQGSEFKDALARGACGTKIRDIHRWGSIEATFLHARAVALYKRVLKTETAAVDCCWASIYRAGDHCLPHSHVRSQASLVYMLDPGEDTPGDPLSGKFIICDPRLPACCQREPGRMTDLMIPDFRPGTLLMFPGSVVHCVSPYTGSKPRITLSWNINPAPLEGQASDAWKKPANA